MTVNAILQLVLFFVVLLLLVKPLGAYMARIYMGESALANRIGGPVERLIYKLGGVDPARCGSESGRPR